jgi:hypothetical protein
MPTWTIRTQTSDLRRAFEIAEDQRNRGYEVSIEDENGAPVGETAKNKQTDRSAREFWIGVLVLLGIITVLIGGLYLMGVWVDGVW